VKWREIDRRIVYVRVRANVGQHEFMIGIRKLRVGIRAERWALLDTLGVHFDS
jgi:hypothetical protein